MVIPIKRLLQTDPPGLQSAVPGTLPGDFICTAVEHEVNGRSYAEFAFYNYTDQEPLIRCFCAFDDDGSIHVRKWCESGEFSADIQTKLYRHRWDMPEIPDSEYATELARKWLPITNFRSATVARRLDRINADRRAKEGAVKADRDRQEADGYMRQIPEIEITAELISWIKRNVVRENFLFLFSRKYRDPLTGMVETVRLCQCTVCGAKSLRAQSMKHGEHDYCPECFAPVTCYDAGRSRMYLTRSGVFKIISRIGREGFCLRTFRIIADFTRCDPRDPLSSQESELKLSEETRHVYDVDSGKFVRYENCGDHWHKSQSDFFRNRGEEACTNVGYGCYNVADYRRISQLWFNLDLSADAVVNTRLRYLDWHTVLNGVAGCNTPVEGQVDVLDIRLEEILFNFVKYPIYELFAKAGAYHLFNTSACGISYYFDMEHPPKSKILQTVPKNILFELLRRNVRYEYIGSVIKCHDLMPEWNVDELLTMVRFAGRFAPGYLFDEEYRLLHLRKLPKMILKYHYDPDIYRDYLADCRKLGYDLTSEDIEFPPDLIRAHADTNAQVIIKRNRKLSARIAEVAKKNAIYGWTDGNVLIRPAISVEDLISEGSQQNNCVAKNYMESYAEGNCVILFARRTSDPDKSYITIEVRGDRVVQARLAHNAVLDEEANALMETYDRKVLAPIRARSLKRNKNKKKNKKEKERITV